MKSPWFLVGLLWVLAQPATAQTQANLAASGTDLDACIQYALTNQPLIRQSIIDQEIADRTVRSAIAAWYPQIGTSYNLQHYLQLPVTLIPDAITGERRPVALGARNTSVASLSVAQAVFNRDVLLARRTADAYRIQAAQTTSSNKIDVVVNVSKAFYDVVLTQRQVEVVTEDLARLQRSLQDASNQYQAGVVDRTDPQRAKILLNTALAQRKQLQEQVAARLQTLKQLMGYPPRDELAVTYDTLQLANEALLDTLLLPIPQNRIEYQLLQTQRNLLDANVRYARWAYLPNVGLYGNYNLLYQNNIFVQLYNQVFPNSLIGLSLTLPIYQGGRRIQQQRIAELQVRRLDWDLTNLNNTIDAEYVNALAAYKGNLALYQAQRENQQLAQDVYRVIDLQYRSGIRTYLDVAIAQSDLRNARLNVFVALNQLLVSKIDVERALGTIRF